MRAEIDCLAVTDHNSGDWIDCLKEALSQLDTEKSAGYRPLLLFAGVEITVTGGVHLLAILPSEKGTTDIARLFGSVGFEKESDQQTHLSFEKVAAKIEEAGGIAIPAHVDREKRLFKMLSGQSLQTVLSCDHIFAMEIVDSQFEKPKVYTEVTP